MKNVLEKKDIENNQVIDKIKEEKKLLLEYKAYNLVTSFISLKKHLQWFIYKKKWTKIDIFYVHTKIFYRRDDENSTQ